jgi:hypothetical protein
MHDEGVPGGRPDDPVDADLEFGLEAPDGRVGHRAELAVDPHLGEAVGKSQVVLNGVDAVSDGPLADVFPPDFPPKSGNC